MGLYQLLKNDILLCRSLPFAFLDDPRNHWSLDYAAALVPIQFLSPRHLEDRGLYSRRNGTSGSIFAMTLSATKLSSSSLGRYRPSAWF